MTFYQKLKSSSDHVLMYEDRLLQQKARDVIPLLELNQKAQEKCLNQPPAEDGKERFHEVGDNKEIYFTMEKKCVFQLNCFPLYLLWHPLVDYSSVVI